MLEYIIARCIITGLAVGLYIFMLISIKNEIIYWIKFHDDLNEDRINMLLARIDEQRRKIDFYNNVKEKAKNDKNREN